MINNTGNFKVMTKFSTLHEYYRNIISSEKPIPMKVEKRISKNELSATFNINKKDKNLHLYVPKIKVKELQIGDIIITKNVNAVSKSQMVTRIFSSEVTKLGNYLSVHCMLVVDNSYDNCVTIAHVTQIGGYKHYLWDIENYKITNDSIFDTLSGVIYRLNSKSINKEIHKRIICYTTKIAKYLSKPERISFNSLNSLSCTFKDPLLFNFLDSKDSFYDNNEYFGDIIKHIYSKKPFCPTPMFCTEFIIKCYQLSLIDIKETEREKCLNIMNLNSNAASPMCLEGFLKTNGKLYGDWQQIGYIDYIISDI